MQFFEEINPSCKILYLVGELGPGGLERQLVYLIKNMDRGRYFPSVVVWNHHSQGSFFLDEFTSLGVPLHTFPKGLPKAKKLKAIRGLVKELSPGIVHSYSFYTNFAAWYASFGSTSVPIGSIRQNFLFERKKSGIILGRLSARWPAIQICNSLAAKSTAENLKGSWKPKSIYFVRNSLDLKQFPFSTVPQGMPTLLAVGRLFEEKRWDRLLRSLAAVRSKGMEFNLLHAGEGPLRQTLERQANDLGLGENVRFLGVQKDISGLLRKTTFLVHTADAEGCPNVVMEAMACGRAVVATDAGDVPCLVEDGKTGFLVNRRNEGELTNRIVTLIKDERLCQRMGRAGRTKAEREFGLDRLVHETIKVYRLVGLKDS